MSVIANTTIMSNFACIGQINLLRRLYGTLYISVEVYAEIQAGLEEGYLFYAALDHQIFPMTESGWIHLTSMTGEQEFRLFSGFPSRLHQGEASSLAIACQRGWLFLTDSLDARTTAAQLAIRLSGSPGCLVLAIEHQLCSLEQANSWLGQMIQEGSRSPVRDLTALRYCDNATFEISTEIGRRKDFFVWSADGCLNPLDIQVLSLLCHPCSIYIKYIILFFTKLFDWRAGSLIG